MKINLDTPIKLEHRGSKAEKLGEVIKTAMFQAPGKGSRGIYDKVAKSITEKKSAVELSISELSTIQEAVNMTYIPGVQWQVDDVINGKS